MRTKIQFGRRHGFRRPILDIGVVFLDIDDSGRFYKPLQDGDRGSKEEAFYSSFTANSRIPDQIRKFFPNFYGTKKIEASDGSGLIPHLILQDLVSGRSNPSVMDVKIGARTWYPEANEKYIEKCLKKDRDSTSVLLGFRISGLKVFESNESGFWNPGKKVVKGFGPDDVRVALKQFVSSNSSINPKNPDCAFAASVYGGILAQMLELKSWFEVQTMYHFNSASVLMLYGKEKEEEEGKACVSEIKLVDFAHVVDGNGVIDHNFLGGLCSLIKFVSEIVDSAKESSSKAPITKGYLTACVVATIAFHLGIYHPAHIALVYEFVFSRYQVWRLFTNFFFLGKFSMNFGIRLLMIARHGVQLEKGPFERKTADFLWMMIFGALSLLIFVLSAVSPEKMPLVLQNIKKVLKPNGRVLFRDYAVGDLAQERLNDKDQRISENFYVRGDGTRAYYFSNDFLTGLFKENGFETEELGVCCKQVENRSRDLVMNRMEMRALLYNISCPCISRFVPPAKGVM